MNLRDFTYNDISMMAFGESQGVKADIDALVYENDQMRDVLHEQAQEIAEMKGENKDLAKIVKNYREEYL